MTMWAILSGIEGNLAAYEAVLADLKRQRSPIDALYILGDVISPVADNTAIMQRLCYPRSGELEPQVCQGWWEEQLLTLHGLGRSAEPTELIDRYGLSVVKQLWDGSSRSLVDWIKSLDFGLFELDCLLVHGSSISVSDELTPDTDAIFMLDRLLRMDANYLFCGRSGLAFEYAIHRGSVVSEMTTLTPVPELVPAPVPAPVSAHLADPRSEPLTEAETVTLRPRKIIGVGNVGRVPGQATYTLYQPYAGNLEFRTVRYGTAKGFSQSRSQSRS
ncbi:metallophosphatase [Alkalinema sp. FACHB-956]|uniref:metallophosphatase n=1 Tax=Alkalinema sp. FACHB-956 TaxID=2692768 RepID=UPI001686DAD2|nr:metallophosphatase [Alkalinema sp. FACHB-956]